MIVSLHPAGGTAVANSSRRNDVAGEALGRIRQPLHPPNFTSVVFNARGSDRIRTADGLELAGLSASQLHSQSHNVRLESGDPQNFGSRYVDAYTFTTGIGDEILNVSAAESLRKDRRIQREVRTVLHPPRSIPAEVHGDLKEPGLERRRRSVLVLGPDKPDKCVLENAFGIRPVGRETGNEAEQGFLVATVKGIEGARIPVTVSEHEFLVRLAFDHRGFSFALTH